MYISLSSVENKYWICSVSSIRTFVKHKKSRVCRHFRLLLLILLSHTKPQCNFRNIFIMWYSICLNNLNKLFNYNSRKTIDCYNYIKIYTVI